MAKKKQSTALAGRAWSLVRLAFLWARRGGVFKRAFMADLIRRYLKSLRSIAATNRDSIGYAGEREFSFDETPLFHFKLNHKSTGSSARFKYLPAISCVNPAVDDDDDAADDPRAIFRTSFNDVGDQEIRSPRHWEQDEIKDEDESNDEGEEDVEIDAKAEEFIERFYREMRMQRQVSYLEYNEMLERGAN